MSPLRVSDLIGLDVRLHIVEYLNRELDAPHFDSEPFCARKSQGEIGKEERARILRLAVLKRRTISSARHRPTNCLTFSI
jgi:3-hydroxyacyl-CoA dehydrogenase